MFHFQIIGRGKAWKRTFFSWKNIGVFKVKKLKFSQSIMPRAYEWIMSIDYLWHNSMRGKKSTRRKPSPNAKLSTINPTYALVWYRIEASHARCPWPTAEPWPGLLHLDIYSPHWKANVWASKSKILTEIKKSQDSTDMWHSRIP